MQSEDFDKWLVHDLKTLLLQYNITNIDIKGSGKNGNVIKKDYIKMAKKLPKNDVDKNTIIDNETNLDENIWFNIMLNLNDEDLINSCFTNKTSEKVCHNNFFWENKFKYDHLTLFNIPQNLNEWLKEFKKSSVAHTLAIKLLSDFTLKFTQYNLTQYHVDAVYKIMLIRLLYEIYDILSTKIKQIIKPKLDYFKKYQEWMEFFIDGKEPLRKLSTDDLKLLVLNLLTEMLYYKNIIIDSKKLNKIMKYIGMYISPNYKIELRLL